MIITIRLSLAIMMANSRDTVPRTAAHCVSTRRRHLLLLLFILVAVDKFVMRSWKKHMKGDHNKAIEALKHYFTQVCSGVGVLLYSPCRL